MVVLRIAPTLSVATHAPALKDSLWLRTGKHAKVKKKHCVVVFVSHPKGQHYTIYMLFILFI